MQRSGTVLFLLFLKAVASEYLSPVNLALNDSVTGMLGHICAYSLRGPDDNPIIPKLVYVLIDVRDLMSPQLALEPTLLAELTESRMAQMRQQFPAAFELTKLFALIMPEDPQGSYNLATTLDIDVVLTANDHLTNGDIRILPNPSFFGQVFYFLNEDLNQLVLKRNMDENSASGLLIDFVEPMTLPISYGILAFFILKLLSLTSILVASVIVYKNHEELLEIVRKNNTETNQHPVLKTLVPCCFILSSIGVILLAFFFYDIMVYFFISMFVIVGASSMSYVFSMAVFSLVSIPRRFEFLVCKQNINLIKLISFFTFLSFTITWCVFRNDPSVGWIMQDIIGVFIIIQLLSEVSLFISFKVISAGFLVFVIYDVFFVFITPFLMSSQSASTASSALISSNVHEQLTRSRRNAVSIMEAVATGSAGKSGELMPLTFKVSSNIFMPKYWNVCASNRNFVLLGFGDAVLPGILCVFLAFFDACWKRKVPYNCIASLFGYCLGGIVVSSVLFSTNMAQPALLYLCPLTLATTIVFAYLRGGKEELAKLWDTRLPTQSSLKPSDEDKPHYPDDIDTTVYFANPDGQDPVSSTHRDRPVV